MSLSKDSLAEREWKFIRRKQFQTKQGLEKIRWEYNVLGLEIEAIKSGKAIPNFGLLGDRAIEIVVEDANTSQDEASSSDNADQP